MYSILIIDPNVPFRKSLSKIINDRFPRIKILEVSAGDEAPSMGFYESGTWGPGRSDDFIAADGREWFYLCGKGN